MTISGASSPSIAHYRLLELLGRGAMGEVWLGEDSQLARKVAVKILPGHLTSDPEAVERLMREARAAASVDHPGVVTVYDAGVHEGRPYLVMQRVEGETLESRLQRGPLPVDEAIRLVQEVADALAEVHALGIVHRDLKTANLMMTPRGVKILVFGIASLKGATRLTNPGDSVGTPLFMSPEQIRGQAPDNRSDLWSLGVILYECLTGRMPFEGDNFETVAYSVLNVRPESPGKSRAEVGSDLDYICQKLLRKEPEHRYARAEELLADLASCELCLVKSGGDSTDKPVAPAIPRIAVLYFDVLSSDPDDAFLAAGLVDDLIVDLTRLEGLRVASRAEVAPLRDRQLPPRTIARELGVEYLVLGSVRRAGQRARISAQLLRASDGQSVWAERYDRTIEDLFDVQAEVSRSIVAALQVALKPGENEMLEKAPTRDPRAYSEYIRAVELFTDESMDASRRGEELLLAAIKKDPEFALAHAALAETYSLRCWRHNRSAGLVELTIQSGRRALQLCSDLPDAYIALARAHFMKGDGPGVLENIDKLLAQDPDRIQALEWAAWAYNVVGKPERAMDLLQRVLARDPGAYRAYSTLISSLEMLGRSEELLATRPQALEAAQEFVRRNPAHGHARSILAIHLIEVGRAEEGIKQARMAVEIAPNDLAVAYNLACSLSRSGRLEEAVQALEARHWFSPDEQVSANLTAGAWFENDPDLKNLRDYEPFKQYIAKLKQG